MNAQGIGAECVTRTGALGIALVVAMCLPSMAAKTKIVYKEITVGSSASISGKVVLKGDAPAAKSKTINKDVETCGDGERVYDKTIVGADGAVKAVVVYIDGIAEGKAGVGKVTYELEQVLCAFLPKQYVVRKGAKLRVMNKDGVFHNIHTYEMAGKARITMFNSGQPANSEFTKLIRMRRPNSHAIKLECDAHNFMHSWLFAADNPYYAVTAEDGSFEISGIPPGTYKLSAWHPVLGTLDAEITVAADKAVTHTFSFGE